jgi:hypothetical protein
MSGARLLLAMVVAAMGISSAAEARHWRYHWHYHHGFYRGTDEDRAKTPRFAGSAIIDPALRRTTLAGAASG